MATMSWALNLKVEGGPTISTVESTDVEAYDQVEVTLAAGADTTVTVSPGPAASVKLLLIRLKQSTPYPVGLNYKVGAKGPYALDAPHFLSGTGAVALLAADPAEFKFTNGAAADVTVQVFVGRDATP